MARTATRPFASRAVAGALCVLAACGGDEGEAGPTSEAPATTTATTVPESTTEPSTVPDTTAPATSVATTLAAPASTTVPTDPSATTAATPVATTTAGTTASGGSWQDPDGVYHLDFPTEPTQTELQVPLPDGSTIPVTAYVAELEGAAAISSCVAYPDGTIVDATAALEGAREGALTNIGADLVDSEAIELQGRPGIAFRGAIGEAGSVEARVFLDALDLCQVLVVGEPPVVSEIAPPLLDSFEFLQEAA